MFCNLQSNIVTIWFILGSLFGIHNLNAQCNWKHQSEIDCSYQIAVGFICDCGSYTHRHSFSTPILCPFECGCWGFPGNSQRTAGCGNCGWQDDTLCPLIGGVRARAYKFLETEIPVHAASPLPGIRAYDWRDAPYQEDECGGPVNTVICCAGIFPTNCQSCGCGAAEIRWLESETYLRPGHYPYYPPCPEP